MAVEIEPVDELVLWNRPAPGEVAPWVRWTIATACAITVAVVFASTQVVWGLYKPFRDHEDLFVWGPPLLVSLGMAIAFAPRAATSRWLRMALLLPAIHVVVMVLAWRLATALHLFELADVAPLACDVPVLPFAIAMLGLTVGAGWLIGRRRRRDGRHAAVTMALANLLLLGLWLPVASRLLAGTGRSLDRAAVALQNSTTLVAVIGPPFVMACAYAAAVVHAPRYVSRLRSVIVAALLALFSLAVAARAPRDLGDHQLYEDFVNEVLAVAFVAIAVIVALGALTWLDSRRLARRLRRGLCQRGTIERCAADEVVACVQVTSWLRGPRLVSRPFVVTTDRGDLRVPGGIEIAAGLPLVSSVLHVGEAVAVLRGGDRIALAGFVDATAGDHPFRGADLLVPEPAGVVVDLADAPATSALQAVQLATWRPAIAYLAIVAVVAVPGLYGLLGRRWW